MKKKKETDCIDLSKKSFLLFHRSLLFNPPFISFIGHTYIKNGGWKFRGEDGFNTILTFAVLMNEVSRYLCDIVGIKIENRLIGRMWRESH